MEGLIMALTACKECGNQISDDAKACPKCGKPAAKKTSFGAMVALVLVSVIGVTIIANSCQDTAHAPLTAADQQRIAAAQAQQKTYETAAAAGANAQHATDIHAQAISVMAKLGAKKLKDSMRDPDSFTIVMAIETGSAICYQYRSRNGFGGMNVEQAVLRLKDGHIFSGQSVYDSWEAMCANRRGTDSAADLNRFLAR
jgi:hypothetical protein